MIEIKWPWNDKDYLMGRVEVDLREQRNFSEEEYLEEQQKRNGSPFFYALTREMEETHHRKSHDYASNNDPYANYKFAGMMSKLFNNPDDAGFIGRIGEKLYRLANLDNNEKVVLNESIDDTEKDIVTIAALWVVMRRERRAKQNDSSKS